MKRSLCALFVLFAFIASVAKASVVLDTNGDIVSNGGSYYIHPFIWPSGGGMILKKTGNETCPLSVGPYPSLPIDTNYGLPWTIASPLRIRFIRTNMIVDFFSVEGEVPNCVTSPSKWTIVEEEDGIQYVKITGYENTVKGVFKIQQFGTFAYKIVFCPTEGDSCGDIGISIDKGKRLLAIKDYAMGFIFIKVESSEVSKQMINNVLEA